MPTPGGPGGVLGGMLRQDMRFTFSLATGEEEEDGEDDSDGEQVHGLHRQHDARRFDFFIRLFPHRLFIVIIKTDVIVHHVVVQTTPKKRTMTFIVHHFALPTMRRRPLPSTPHRRRTAACVVRSSSVWSSPVHWSNKRVGGFIFLSSFPSFHFHLPVVCMVQGRSPRESKNKHENTQKPFQTMHSSNSLFG